MSTYRPAPLRGAMHGDRVEVRIVARRPGGRQEGSIVRVLTRAQPGSWGVSARSGALPTFCPMIAPAPGDLRPSPAGWRGQGWPGGGG